MRGLLAAALVVLSAHVAIGAPSVGDAVTVGRVTARGEYPGEILRRYVLRSRERLGACYAAARASKPTLRSSATVALAVTVDGAVTDVTVTGIRDDDFQTCIAATLARLVVPRPAGTKPVTARIPLTFAPPRRVPPSNPGRDGTLFGGRR